MKQKRSLILATIVAAILVIFIPTNLTNVSAASQEIPYKIVEAGGDGVSIADGYFVKPAKYTVENGKKYVQVTLRDAGYVKSLSGPHGAVQVISDNGDKRVIKMQVDDLSKPVNLEMHVVVPKEVAGMDYDQKHKARAIFDASGIKDDKVAAQSTDGDDKDKTTVQSIDGDNKDNKVDNPQTSDTTPLTLYSVLAVGSAAILFVIWKRRPARN